MRRSKSIFENEFPTAERFFDDHLQQRQAFVDITAEWRMLLLLVFVGAFLWMLTLILWA
jgi:ABC-type siderophore export system fused ATPase/permease subunit